MESNQELFIGLDLGGTFVKYALGFADGKLILKGKKPTQADKSQLVVFNVIFQAIDELLEEAKKLNGRVVAIGFGSPGAVDFDHGKLLGNTPNFADWGEADIRGTIESRYHFPVWADNDANLMAFAESRQGSGRGYNNIIALTLGTGIGGGILIDGQLYRGTNCAGAELGHITIKYDGIPCNCGGVGCIERYASAPAMVMNYIEKLKKSDKPLPVDVTTETIFCKAANKEKEAIETIKDTCEYLGAALASILNIFNPQIVIIGGGVAEAGDGFIEKIRKVISSRAMKPSIKGLRLVRAQLGNDAGMVGAINLAAEMYHNKIGGD
jgi:glucokinase